MGQQTNRCFSLSLKSINKKKNFKCTKEHILSIYMKTKINQVSFCLEPGVGVGFGCQ